MENYLPTWKESAFACFYEYEIYRLYRNAIMKKHKKSHKMNFFTNKYEQKVLKNPMLRVASFNNYLETYNLYNF